MGQVVNLPKGCALCPVCRKRGYREPSDIGVCSKCRGPFERWANSPIEKVEPPFKISCVVPFDKRLSKNAQKTPFKGRMILTADARSSSTALVESLRRCITGRPRKVKTLVSIRVMKPDHRMDAVNFVDVVCDCIQKASGLNDRFYSLAVDWEIDKSNPRIEIEVGQ